MVMTLTTIERCGLQTPHLKQEEPSQMGAAALNRMILSELRRVEKRTRIRSECASGDTIDRFFDYVPKGSRPAQGK